MVRGEAGFTEEYNKACLLYKILYLENGRLSSAKNDEIALIAIRCVEVLQGFCCIDESNTTIL